MKTIAKMIVLLIIIGFSTPISAISGQKLNLTAKKSSHQFPFFDEPTPVWAYNGSIPGPIIKGKEGQTIEIDFINNLDEPSSIHWHGLIVDNAMDGVPGVTQDPVKPGESFTYRLKLRDAGTYWYHPHLNGSVQLGRGLKGALIVESDDKLPWSQDIVWLIDDWLLEKTGSIYPRFNTGHDLMHDGRWGNVVTINGNFQPVFSVSPGERIRLRLINGANARVLMPVLNGIDTKVIAVDGKPVSHIFKYEGFDLAPGNRIDLDIVIPTEAHGQTYSVEDGFTRNRFPLATIKVEEVPSVQTPVFDPPTAEDFLPAEIFAGVAPFKTWDLEAIRGGQYGIGWAMNRLLWPNSDPADIRLGQPQKIVFNNNSSRLHPMHIHGIFFRVLERNGKPVAEPFTRDTILLGSRESAVIGLVPTEPGIWMSHCHIQSHAEAGMMTTVNVAPQNQN